jgi:hypothetical protein
MGGGHSRNRYRAPPPPQMMVPKFPYPDIIFRYLLSQSVGYIINYSTPSGGDGSFTSDLPPPEPTPPWSPTETTAAVTTTPFTITKPPTPAPTTIPSYSTTTAPNNNNNNQTQNQNNDTINWSQNKDMGGDTYWGAPVVWIAAIQAMQFVRSLGPLSEYSQLETLYDNLEKKINIFRISGGGEGVKNASALIYFCTVVTVSFAPFTKNLHYNFLNGEYPSIFIDASIYRKFFMVHYLASHANQMFVNSPLSNNDRVMLYAVPILLQSIIKTVSSTNPISDEV